MQVTETSNEGLKREFSVVVPKVDVDGRLNGRLTEVGANVDVPGFRPGKVPLKVLKQRFGQAVRGEILEQTIQETVQKTLEDRDLRPALEPKIDIVTFDDGTDLEYTLTVEVIPEIDPPDFGTLELERLVAEVPDEDVDQSITRIADQRKAYAVEAGRKAIDGDQLVMNFVGRIDGETFDGGTADGMELVLGGGQFIPGFEEQLLGAAAGDNKEVTVTFPDDYAAENLKSKVAVFEVEVSEVRASTPVVIDDEFAKSMGADDLEALKTMVSEQIGSEYVQISRGRLKRALLDELSDRVDFDVPPGLLEAEFESIWKQLEEAKEREQMDEDDKGLSDEELEDRYRGIAARRIRLGLLLAETGRVNNLTVNQDDLNKVMGQQAQRFPGQEAQIMKYYQENPQAMQELQAPILEEKVVDYILELANVTERKVSKEELVADPDDADVKAKAKPKKAKKKPKSRAKVKTKPKGK
ncbi:MAG: trigger factor [Pseudomonadota bacterium]|nr:trigger factor [Pseudomonadota bacterium]